VGHKGFSVAPGRGAANNQDALASVRESDSEYPINVQFQAPGAPDIISPGGSDSAVNIKDNGSYTVTALVS
jgi:hypothetical protein